MPSSTVFSYWRRDHRRSTAAPPIPSIVPAAPSSKGTDGSPANTTPQLPAIPHTPSLTTSFDDQPSKDAPPPRDSPVDGHNSKPQINTSAAVLSSSASLAVPSPSPEKDKRPHSSPEERDRDLDLSSPASHSQPPASGPQPEPAESELNAKPSLPFRRSFGKGSQKPPAPPAENQKRSPTAPTGTTAQFRLKISPDGSPTDKTSMPKESKADGAATRRTGERDVSGEHGHHKSGKAMLHLLNPISLLARRRSSHAAGSRADDVNIGAQNLVPAIPDDYDPRIRGNIVHDFSAPRPRRNVSASAPGANKSNCHDLSQNTGQDALYPWSDQRKRHSDHSPVFKEHFEDDQNMLHVENKGYLQSQLLTNSSQPGHEQSIPVFARKLPYRLPENAQDSDEPPTTTAEETSNDSKTSPPLDPDTIPNVHHQPSGLPKHFMSNASRFSFDMNGVESSTQEKLLEEKHKEKEAARKLEDDFFDDFDDDLDNELLDDMDDLEEKIPGVNVDADDDDFSTPAGSQILDGNIKPCAAPGLSPVVASRITPAAPPDFSGDTDPTGPRQAPQAHQSNLPASYQYEDSQFAGVPKQSQSARPAPVTAVDTLANMPQTPPSQKPQSFDDDEDDLYFDDGDFGDLNVDRQEEGFDESIFDDETSHLYDRKPVREQAMPASFEENTLRRDTSVGKDSLLEEDGSESLKHMPSVASEHRATTSVKRGPLGECIPNMGPVRSHGGILTEQNLEVLHNALAFAANEAASQGRFERTFSTSERSLAQESVSKTSQTADSQPGLVSDDSHLSQAADVMGYEDAFEDWIGDINGDAYYDDPIVAAANAEALENDDEGFYGQEFGFYAQQAHGNCSSELTNGGYFGSRGVEGITRSHSGRANFQEPSLTPITERSEWSTRNSVISLKAHGAAHSNPSLSSPGLAQLVDMGNLDDEMSLSALMKLRRDAWGGSNGSLRSTAGSPQPHTLSSSHRGSFTGASETSPTISDGRPVSADEAVIGGVSYHPVYGHPPTTGSTLLTTGAAGHCADLPASGIGGLSAREDEVPINGV